VSSNYVVLEKLSNTVKWSTFCVSFVRILTILGWLYYFKIFKIDYLVTSNVRFGMVSVNPVTFLMQVFVKTSAWLEVSYAFTVFIIIAIT